MRILVLGHFLKTKPMGSLSEKWMESLQNTSLPDLFRTLNPGMAWCDIESHSPLCEESKRLQRSWMGVRFLIQMIGESTDVSVDAFDSSWTEMAEEFTNTNSYTRSVLYQLVYSQELDTPGGIPYTMILADWELDSTPECMFLLQSMACIAKRAHCLFLAGVSPAFFAKKSMAELFGICDLPTYMERGDFFYWHQFRQRLESAHVALLLPDFYLASGQWVNPVFAYGAQKIAEKSHSSFDLWKPVQVESDLPLAMAIPQSHAQPFIQLGLIPLVLHTLQDQILFLSDNTACQIPSGVPRSLDLQFLLCGVAQELRVTQRESIGAVHNSIILQRKLNEWLRQKVTVLEHPDDFTREKYPFRDAWAEVLTQSPCDEGYSVRIHLVPHGIGEGMASSFELDCELPMSR